MIGFIPVRKRRVGSNLSAVTALLLITIVLTGCLARVGGPSDQDRWLEVFEFEIQPPDLDDGQAAERVADISGGAEHTANLTPTAAPSRCSVGRS